MHIQTTKYSWMLIMSLFSALVSGLCMLNSNQNLLHVFQILSN